jgi:hypothetical protein
MAKFNISTCLRKMSRQREKLKSAILIICCMVDVCPMHISVAIYFAHPRRHALALCAMESIGGADAATISMLGAPTGWRERAHTDSTEY